MYILYLTFTRVNIKFTVTSHKTAKFNLKKVNLKSLGDKKEIYGI